MSDKRKLQAKASGTQDEAGRIAEQKAARLQAALRDNLRRRKAAAQLTRSVDDLPGPYASHAEDEEAS